MAHEIGALLLNKAQKARYDVAPLLALKRRPLFTEEMMAHCLDYAEYVHTQSKGAFIYVECTYDMSAYIPSQFGTADASFFKDGVLHVIDFKYGAGVPVKAEHNPQLMCYALGAYAFFEKRGPIKEARLHIYQPRAGGVSTWGISIPDLLRWARETAGPKAALALAGEGDFAAGEHCRFCKARERCKAFYDLFAEIRGLSDRRELTDADLSTVLTYGPLVASWIKSVEENSVLRMERGESIPGFKLVEGRGHSQFRNEDEVVDILIGEDYESEQIFDSKLKGITAIKKLLGAKKFDALFREQLIRIAGSNKIAPEEDARPAAGSSAANEYD